MANMKTVDPDQIVKQINDQVKNVQGYITELNKMKEQAITKLENDKKALRQKIQMGLEVSKTSLEVTQQIQYVIQEHETILKKLMEKYRNVKTISGDAAIVYDILQELDEEIARIQAEHTDYVHDLQNKQDELQKYAADMNSLKLLFDAITYKIFAVQEEQVLQLERLEQERLRILNDPNLTDEERALALARLDREKEEILKEFALNMKGLKDQRGDIENEALKKAKDINSSIVSLLAEERKIQNRLEAQKALGKMDDLLVFDSKMDMAEHENNLKNGLDELRKMLLNASPSQAELIKAKIKQLEDRLIAMKEKQLEDMLRDKGLEITPSGHLRTLSGRIISLDEALRLGYIDEKDKLLLANMLMKRQAEAKSQRSESSSHETLLSTMSSEDVSYLKSTIGKPLTLALSEITMMQPRDPIHYLAHWLIKYRYNQEDQQKKQQEFEELCAERTRIEKELLHKLFEDEAQRAILHIIQKAEDIALKKEIDAQLRRIALEAAMAEEEEYDSEARDVLGVYDGPTVKQNIPA